MPDPVRPCFMTISLRPQGGNIKGVRPACPTRPLDTPDPLAQVGRVGTERQVGLVGHVGQAGRVGQVGQVGQVRQGLVLGP